MSFLNKGNGGGASKQAAGGRRTDRYAGLRPNQQTPRLVKGRYLIEIETVRRHMGQEGLMVFVDVKVVEASEGSGNAANSSASFGYGLATPKQQQACMPKILSLCMAATHHEDFEAFKAAYPTWEDLLDRVLGEDIDEDTFGPDPLKGAQVRVEAVLNGKTAEDGTPYHNYVFKPAGE